MPALARCAPQFHAARAAAGIYSFVRAVHRARGPVRAGTAKPDADDPGPQHLSRARRAVSVDDGSCDRAALESLAGGCPAARTAFRQGGTFALCRSLA